ncbi:MAG: hypothetical protein QOH29_2774, partial [Actinomycetota bacterium]|nr:hypothetical protein [Actinomycetota bacterium]
MPQVFMPRLSDTMTEGTVSTWTKSVGERVEKGDVIAEIETDKATMELEAYDAGVLEQILVGVGTTVPIGEVIAVIGDGTGAASSAPAAAAATAPAAPAVTTPAIPAAAPVASAPAAAPTPPSIPAPVSLKDASAGSWANGNQVKASPLARALARDAGLDLGTVRGSGPGGRIVRADVQDAVAALTTSGPARGTSAGTSASAPVLPAGVDDVEVPLNNVRRITARRLVESMQQAPHFYLTRVIAADELVAARARINVGLAAVAPADTTAPKISVNDLVVKAVASALRAHP